MRKSARQEDRPLKLEEILSQETIRHAEFPVTKESIYLAHASITPLPSRVTQAMKDYLEGCNYGAQEGEEVLQCVQETRTLAAQLIGATPQEIALLGPTSLGLSLFANGIQWQEGDEILCYLGDYPANVYPWANLEKKGVRVLYLQPETPGYLSKALVESALNERTRLVALPSCHYLTGYRVDVSAIGQMLHERGILFSLDAIQTLGAFPTRMEYVDMMSAAAFKWLLGPMGIGIVYVDKKNWDIVHPTLLGAGNVHSPDYIAQEEIVYVDSAQRYEPGAPNFSGIVGLNAALKWILSIGVDAISQHLLQLGNLLVQGMEELGYLCHSPREAPLASGIVSFSHQEKDLSSVFAALSAQHIIASLRKGREGTYLRFSPHFYITEEEIERVLQALKAL